MKASHRQTAIVAVFCFLALTGCGVPAQQGALDPGAASTGQPSGRIFRTDDDQFQIEVAPGWEVEWLKGRTYLHPSKLPSRPEQGQTIVVEIGTPDRRPFPDPDVIAILDDAFNPGAISVATGTTVTWVSHGSLPHTVTADDGSFDSSPGCSPPALDSCLREKDQFQFTFDRTGRFLFHCKIHGAKGGLGMYGLVFVFDAPPAQGSTTEGEIDGHQFQRGAVQRDDGSLVITYFIESWQRNCPTDCPTATPPPAGNFPLEVRIAASNDELWNQYGAQAERMFETMRHDPPADLRGPVDTEFGVVAAAISYDRAVETLTSFMFGRFVAPVGYTPEEERWMTDEAVSDYRSGDLQLYGQSDWSRYEIERRDEFMLTVRIDWKGPNPDHPDVVAHREQIEVQDAFPGKVVRARFVGYVKNSPTTN